MMNDRQLISLYVVMTVLFVVLYVAVDALVSKPMDAQGYADQLCKELYGPQTGATWEKGTLMCETARGEIIEVRRIK
jgi:hypothetical protein